MTTDVTGFRRILLAVNDSGESAGAISSIAVIASGTDAEVLVLNVWNGEAPEPRGAAEQLVAQIATRLAAQGIAATAKVRVGRRTKVAETIERVAAQYLPDLVALGSRGRGDLTGLALGSISRRVLERVDCAILLGHERNPGPGGKLTRILLALAGNDGDSAALEAASAIALPHKSSVLVLHVLRTLMDTTGSAYLLPAVATAEVLAPAVRTLREQGVAAAEVVVPGSAPGTIVEIARNNGADLIVLGPGRRPSTLTGLVLGDTVNQIIHLSDRPVLVAAAKHRLSAATVHVGRRSNR